MNNELIDVVDKEYPTNNDAIVDLELNSDLVNTRSVDDVPVVILDAD